MNQNIYNRMDMIDLLAKGDDTYRRMLQENAALERQYDQVLSTLERDQQNAICDFLFHCEEMSRYVLEIACTYMRFPD